MNLTKKLLLASFVIGLLGCGDDAMIYEACVTNNDCADSSCFSVAFTSTTGEVSDGAFCSIQCEPGIECPSGRCISLGDEAVPGTVAICFLECTSDDDCDSGLRCSTVDGVDVCTP